MRRMVSGAALAAFVMFANAAVSMAAAHDPTKIGDNIKSVVEPNAKSFWWIAALGGAFAIVLAKKTSRAGGLIFGLFVIGVLIFNPLGVQQMMDSLSNRVI